MAIELKESFQVSAPIDVVWRFMLNPENMAACMPGASLQEVVDERNFVGNIKLKVGAVTSNYKGKIYFSEVDEAAHAISMVAEGKEPSGGTVKGTIVSALSTTADGGTEVACDANIELTGRIMQVGRGMIQGVSKQLFKKFVANVTRNLDAQSEPAGAGAQGAAGAGDTPKAVVADDDSIHILPLLFKTFWAWLRGLFGRAK